MFEFGPKNFVTTPPYIRFVEKMFNGKINKLITSFPLETCSFRGHKTTEFCFNLVIIYPIHKEIIPANVQTVILDPPVSKTV